MATEGKTGLVNKNSIGIAAGYTTAVCGEYREIVGCIIW